jgi:hypothetical protein
MNMKHVVKQYTFMKKDVASIISFDLFKEVEAGFLNGSVDLKNTGFRDFRIKVVLQNEFRTKPLIIWSTRFSQSEKNWSLTRLGVLLSLESALRLSNGSSHRERFVRFSCSYSASQKCHRVLSMSMIARLSIYFSTKMAHRA